MNPGPLPKLLEKLLKRKTAKTMVTIPVMKSINGMMLRTAPPTKIQMYQAGRPVSLMMSQVFQNGTKAAPGGFCPAFGRRP